MNRILSSKAPALLAAVVCCTITLGWPGRATAQAAASGPVEIIVPWGTGGGADQLARETAKLLQRALDTPAKVTNIPGRTGNAAMQKFLASPSDGRLLSVLTAETYCLLAYANPGWKPADVVPLAIMVRQPSAFFCRPVLASRAGASSRRKRARNPGRCGLRSAVGYFGRA